MDDETYREYVESELRVAVKNPLPQSEWGFRACSRRGGTILIMPQNFRHRLTIDTPGVSIGQILPKRRGKTIFQCAGVVRQRRINSIGRPASLYLCRCGGIGRFTRPQMPPWRNCPETYRARSAMICFKIPFVCRVLCCDMVGRWSARGG